MIKKFVFIVALVTSATLATQAQEVKSDSWPYWAVSKDVQRVRFKDVRLVPIQISSGNADWAISKGVHRAQPAPTLCIGWIVARLNAFPPIGGKTSGIFCSDRRTLISCGIR